MPVLPFLLVLVVVWVECLLLSHSCRLVASFPSELRFRMLRTMNRTEKGAIVYSWALCNARIWARSSLLHQVPRPPPPLPHSLNRASCHQHPRAETSALAMFAKEWLVIYTGSCDFLRCAMFVQSAVMAPRKMDGATNGSRCRSIMEPQMAGPRQNRVSRKSGICLARRM